MERGANTMTLLYLVDKTISLSTGALVGVFGSDDSPLETQRPEECVRMVKMDVQLSGCRRVSIKRRSSESDISIKGHQHKQELHPGGDFLRCREYDERIYRNLSRQRNILFGHVVPDAHERLLDNEHETDREKPW